jgi:hypothetical protein
MQEKCPICDGVMYIMGDGTIRHRPNECQLAGYSYKPDRWAKVKAAHTPKPAPAAPKPKV